MPTEIDAPEIVLWSFAVGGSLLFILQCVLVVLNPRSDGAPSHLAVFMHTLVGVLAIFGWTGLLLPQSLPVLLSVRITSSILIRYFVRRLRSSTPTTEPLSTAFMVGRMGVVSQTIHPFQKGVIQLTIGGITRDVQAVSETSSPIDLMLPVRIVGAIDENTVSVVNHIEESDHGVHAQPATHTA